MADRLDMQLQISREAARLFLAHGLAGTSGDAIGAAAGVSTRTVWRHFRHKEQCIAPVLAVSIQRFARIMAAWPLAAALEDHLRGAMPLDGEDLQLIADGALAVQLVALGAREPDILSVWLEAYHRLEMQLREVVARRANRSTLDFDVRLCAAAMVAAVRVVDEAVSTTAVAHERSFTSAELADLVAGAIRAAATLPVCDPIARALPSIARRASGGRG